MSDKIYLHQHPEFKDIVATIADQMRIHTYIVVKDYFIMHSLYSLQQGGFDFKMKGGTSLSKGFDMIGRISEDIDINITPPIDLNLRTGKNHDKSSHRLGRKNYFDWLADKIKIEDVVVERDYSYDDIPEYRHGGIILKFNSEFDNNDLAIKKGVLLEVGFATIIPNVPITISSWAYETAVLNGLDIIDNRAKDVLCYEPGYTFVEKLNAIGTKFPYFKSSGIIPVNFVRHYYDLHCLLQDENIRAFIDSDAFEEHKQKCFAKKVLEIPLAENQAFLLSDPEDFKAMEAEYLKNKALYYQGQPDFNTVMGTIREWLSKY